MAPLGIAIQIQTSRYMKTLCIGTNKGEAMIMHYFFINNDQQSPKNISNGNGDIAIC